MFWNILLALISLILLPKILLEVSSLLRLYKYKKQGVTCKYFPLLGPIVNILKNKDKSDILKLMKEKARVSTADITAWNNGSGTVNLQLTSPQATKEFASQEHIVSRKKNLIDIDILGFAFRDGPAAVKSRRIFARLFHTDNLKAMCPEISKIMIRHVESLKQKILASKEKKLVVNIKNELIKNMMDDVASFVLLGAQQKSELPLLPSGMTIHDAAHKISIMWGKCILSPSNFLTGGLTFKYNLSPAKKEIYAINEEIIKLGIKEYEKRLGSESKGLKDFVSLAVEYNKKMEEEGTPEEKLPLREIGENFELFLEAGSDTSAQTAINLLTQLVENPDYLDNLSSELKDWKIVSSGVEADDIDELEFLKCCFKESLRHQPIVFNSVFRELVKDTKICGKKAFKGDLVVYDMVGTSQREIDHKDSSSFNPNRYSKNESKKIIKYSSNPFAAGHRNCVGQYLAEILTKMIVGLVVKNFEIERAEEVYQRELLQFYVVKNPKMLLRVRE